MSVVKELEQYVVSIPDFPKPGIIFRDVTSILQDPDGLKLSIHELMHLLENTEFDVIAGTESRGFLFGMPLHIIKEKALCQSVKRVSFRERPSVRNMTWNMVQQP